MSDSEGLHCTGHVFVKSLFSYSSIHTINFAISGGKRVQKVAPSARQLDITKKASQRSQLAEPGNEYNTFTAIDHAVCK